ncbi:MAG: endonuclease III [Bacteroidia bacterium]|nr:MAG: endonuclease III [Bacteroidia bacterium]
MTVDERYEGVIAYFKKNMPVAETELEYSTPFELLTAVILSAQCTDKRVNVITKDLFRRFPNPESLAEADIAEVYEYIKTCSYPNNKSKHLVGMAKMLLDNFNGEIPSDIKELQKLPGVGRKTANVILSVIFNKPAMAVDTHVFRVSQRIGLVKKSKTPFQVEEQLVSRIPEELLPIAHHWLILHGRYTCTARKPKCKKCGIAEFCLYDGK